MTGVYSLLLAFSLAFLACSAFLFCVFLDAQPTFTISEALEPQNHAHDAGLALVILLIWRYSSFRQTGIKLPFCFAFSLSREDSGFFFFPLCYGRAFG